MNEVIKPLPTKLYTEAQVKTLIETAHIHGYNRGITAGRAMIAIAQAALQTKAPLLPDSSRKHRRLRRRKHALKRWRKNP